MIARTDQIIPRTPAEDHTGKEGHFVDLTAGEAALSTDHTVEPYGLIIEGAATTGKSSIAKPGVSGMVKVKLSSSPGAVVDGSKLTLAADAGEDSTVELDPGAGDRVQVAEAAEAGAADELIEARLIEPVTLS